MYIFNCQHMAKEEDIHDRIAGSNEGLTITFAVD